MSAEQSITRDNHYLPEFLLKRWSADGQQVFAYRILVSSPKVPEWTRKSTRGIAFHDDLYTLLSGGREVDEFETWMDQTVETPGAVSLHKLVAGNQLARDDWRNIIKLVALQDLRTPQGFLELRKLWNRIVPEALEAAMTDAISQLEAAHARGERLPMPSGKPSRIGRLVRLNIEPPAEPTSDKAKLYATVPSGRRLWLETVRELMDNAATVLQRHRWSVVGPFGDAEWPLTDHPVVRLNYNSEKDYTFEGGWNSPGTEIMMPVSPRHLLYVKVGAKAPNRFTLSDRATQLLQRLLVERAHRWIFAAKPLQWVSQARPRTVDAAALVAEEQAWKAWHQDQVASEAELDSRPPIVRTTSQKAPDVRGTESD